MNIDLARYKGLIFDMDGTLIDSMPAHVESWRLTSLHFDFPFDSDWLYACGGKPSYKIVSDINHKYGLSLSLNDVSNFKQHMFFTLDYDNSRIEETCSIFEKYKLSKKIAVGTGSKRENAINLLKNNQLLNDLDALVTASDVENHKPAPDTFLKACKLMDLMPDECIVFEDTELGKQAAHAGGMDCILVTKRGLVFHSVSEELIRDVTLI